MKQDNDPKHSQDNKGLYQREKVEGLDWPCNSTDLNRIEHVMYITLPEEETEGRKSFKQAKTERSCSTSQEKQHNEECNSLMMSLLPTQWMYYICHQLWSVTLPASTILLD